MTHYLSGGHIETLNAADVILREGGNAYDAAIAAFVASFIAEPAMSSAGGGGFAICTSKGQKPKALDFFSGTPLVKPPDHQIHLAPVQVFFGDETETYFADMGSIAIPGAIRGIFELHRTFATMPLPELFSYGIELAKDGVELNRFQHLDLGLLVNVFNRSQTGLDIFFDEKKSLFPVGQRLFMPEMADFLDVLALEGEDLFYKGEVGQRLVADCREGGGVIDATSLENFTAKWVEPISAPLKEHTLFTMGYPSLGGPLLIHTLGRLMEGSRLEFRSDSYLDFVTSVLIEGKTLHSQPERLFKQMGIHAPPGDNRRGSTSHFNILDRWGNGVAMTMTLGEGSGYFIPGTGVHMNNMLGEPGLLPDGLNSWTPNSRMRSLMSPCIVTDGKAEPVMLTGSGGAVRIPFVMAQVLHHLFQEGASLVDATNRPRMFYDGHTLQLESGSGVSWHPDVPVNLWKRCLCFLAASIPSIAMEPQANTKPMETQEETENIC